MTNIMYGVVIQPLMTQKSWNALTILNCVQIIAFAQLLMLCKIVPISWLKSPILTKSLSVFKLVISYWPPSLTLHHWVGRSNQISLSLFRVELRASWKPLTRAYERKGWRKTSSAHSFNYSSLVFVTHNSFYKTFVLPKPPAWIKTEGFQNIQVIFGSIFLLLQMLPLSDIWMRKCFNWN